VKAVDEVSFSLKKGETLGLVGESGCGKTTLGRSILRLIEPTDGTIFYKDKNLRSLSHHEMRQLRKEMQIIFQDPYSSLNPKMRIGEAILEPMKVHNLYENDKVRQEKVYNWLEKVGLSSEHYKRYPSEFSGGQRQRVCIARALACEPEFVICDESVSALDVSVQAQILNLLKALQVEFGFTYIFISHDLSVVKHISDRVAVMQAGKIVELNDAESLYSQPKMDYTQKLLAAVPSPKS
jgi:peptide/nickel transport system ATP-binding protein